MSLNAFACIAGNLIGLYEDDFHDSLLQRFAVDELCLMKIEDDYD